MHLDMQTMSAVSVAVTVVVGGVLLFTWAREREGPFVGWWGLALLIQAGGRRRSPRRHPPRMPARSSRIGTALIILGDAVKWKAAREFAHRHAQLLWIVLGPVGYLFAAQSDYLQSIDHRLAAVCTILSVYNFAAAIGARPERRRTIAVALARGQSAGRHRSRLFVLVAAQPLYADQRIAMGGCEHLVPGQSSSSPCCCASRSPSSSWPWRKSAGRWSGASRL